jgi:hypothetical protein
VSLYQHNMILHSYHCTHLLITNLTHNYDIPTDIVITIVIAAIARMCSEYDSRVYDILSRWSFDAAKNG